MTDQLMDNLTNEEHEALLLMSEHGIAAPLSPAAQAVLDAANGRSSYGSDDCLNESRWIAAAALRAAADQMRYSDQLGLTGFGGYVQAQDQILVIAAELEAQ